MSLGKRIHDARVCNDLSLEELGKRCGTTKQTIFKYEQGIVTNIPLDRLHDLASTLRVSVAYLLGLTDAPNEVEPANLINRTPRLPEGIVLAAAGSGLKIEPSFDDALLDFGDLSDTPAPPEIYNVFDPKTTSLARFYGDELRSLTPDAASLRSAFEARCISGVTEIRNTLYKLIDSLPDDKLPILEAYLEGLKDK